MPLLDEDMLNDLTIGSAVLGAGGGGDPYIGMLLARHAIREHGPVTLVALKDVPDDARVCFVAVIGAPGVLIEKLPKSENALQALETLERHLGYQFTHICAFEAGGLNAVVPVAPAAIRGLPIIDADGMGRAFPFLDLVTPTLYGGAGTPMALADEHGNRMILMTETNDWSEVISRAATVASGAIQMFASFPMTGVQAKAWLVDAPLARATRLGRIIRLARGEHRRPVDAILAEEGGVRLLEGKVGAVERRTERGWTMGEALVQGTDEYHGRSVRLMFQNEYLVALEGDQVLASTPDLIMTLEADTGAPIPAEEMRYGYRVSVIGLPCDDRWRTADGVALAGPRRFGYDIEYRPVELQRDALEV